jgi:hypothetical protein
MKRKLTTYAAVIAFSTVTAVAAFAADSRDPARNQANQVTAQLNQQQLNLGAYDGSYGTVTYQGIMQSSGPNQSNTREQIAQPPDAGDLSIIE